MSGASKCNICGVSGTTTYRCCGNNKDVRLMQIKNRLSKIKEEMEKLIVEKASLLVERNDLQDED